MANGRDLKAGLGEQRPPFFVGALPSAEDDEHLEVEQLSVLDLPAGRQDLIDDHDACARGGSTADPSEDRPGVCVVPVVKDTREDVHIRGRRGSVREKASWME